MVTQRALAGRRATVGRYRFSVAVAAVLAAVSCAAPPAPPGGPPTGVVVSAPPASSIDSPRAVPQTSAAARGITTPTSRRTTPPGQPTSSSRSTRSETRSASTIPIAAGVGTPNHPIKVTVTGRIMIGQGGDVRACPNPVDALVGQAPGTEPMTPQCDSAIPVTGAIAVDKLSFPQHNSHYQWGQTHLAAWWDGTRLTVRSQRLPADSDQPDDRLSDEVPCPPPAGGWKVGATQNLPGIDRIEPVVGAQFGALALATPYGGPSNENGENPSYSLDHTVQVVIVGVTGNQARATAAIRTVFTGNLCVVHSANSAADVNGQMTKLEKLQSGDWQRLGIVGTRGGQRPTGTPWVSIDVAADTPEIQQLVSSLGRPAVEVRPFVRPEI